MASRPLPRFFSLKLKTTNSNNRYLRYVYPESDPVHGHLKFDGEDVVSPYTRFEAVNAHDIDNPNRVHIRSCYNNKYLRRAGDPENQQVEVGWIVAQADEQESRQILSCTLFDPITIEGNEIKLRHVEVNALLCRTNEYLSVRPESQNFDVFTIIDWSKFVILPKHLAFRGDNEKYISVNENDPSDPYLRFSGDNSAAKTVENEAFPAGDGSVSIHSTYRRKYWKRNISSDKMIKDMIWADGNDSANPDNWFRPVKVDLKVDDANDVVIHLLTRKDVCKRFHWQNDPEGCLYAGGVNVPPPQEQLAVEELVKSRTISNVHFRLCLDPRIYDRIVDKEVAIGSAENHNQLPATKIILLSYEDTKASTWNPSTRDLAFTAFIPTTLTSHTPYLVDGGRIDVSGNFNGTYQWGKRHTSSTPIDHLVRVRVPAKSTVTVTLLATKASCDIPFTYDKTDTLCSEEVGPDEVGREKVGLYTGVSFYDFHLRKDYEPLPAVGG